MLNDVRGIIRRACRGGGREIDARADEYFAVFERAPAAIEAAVAAQRELGTGSTGGFQVRIRIGIHSGRPTLREVRYIGLAVHDGPGLLAAHGG